MSAHKEARAGWGLCQSPHPEPVGREPGCRREGKLETVNPVPHDIIPIMTGGGRGGLGRVLSAGLWGPQHRSRTQSIPYNLYFHVTQQAEAVVATGVTQNLPSPCLPGSACLPTSYCQVLWVLQAAWSLLPPPVISHPSLAHLLSGVGSPGLMHALPFSCHG